MFIKNLDCFCGGVSPFFRLIAGAWGLIVGLGMLNGTHGTALGAVTLQLHGNATEVSGVTNGSIVMPGTAPAGFTGNVVVGSGGSVNFTPAQVGNGVYFLNCCGNTNNAYYNFTGATIGNIFNVNQGQISFYLKSRYSFAERQAAGGSPRFVFDVHDNDIGNHLFYFYTSIATAGSGQYLLFTWRTANSAVNGYTQYFYWVEQASADAVFGKGVTLKVTLSWDGSTTKMYLNNVLVQSFAYTKVTPNWTASSGFNFGAYQSPYGGYNSSDDVINEFTVN